MIGNNYYIHLIAFTHKTQRVENQDLVLMYRHLLILTALVSACGHLITVPENAAVLEGTTVVFKCQSNDTTQNVTWRASTYPSDEVNVSSRDRIEAHLADVYQINNSLPGQFDLHIKASPYNTAKRYQCLDGLLGSSNASAELIVYACNTTRKPDKVASSESVMVELLCRVSHSGNWRPHFTWMSDKSKVSITASVSQKTDENVITTVLTVPFNSEQTARRYIFTATFDMSLNPTETSLNSNHLFSFSWISPTFGNMQRRDDDSNKKSNNGTDSSKKAYNATGIAIGVVLVIAVIVFVITKSRPDGALPRLPATQNRIKQPEQEDNITSLNYTAGAYEQTSAHYVAGSESHTSMNFNGEGEGGHEPSRLNAPITPPPAYESLNVPMYNQTVSVVL